MSSEAMPAWGFSPFSTSFFRMLSFNFQTCCTFCRHSEDLIAAVPAFLCHAVPLDDIPTIPCQQNCKPQERSQEPRRRQFPVSAPSPATSLSAPSFSFFIQLCSASIPMPGTQSSSAWAFLHSLPAHYLHKGRKRKSKCSRDSLVLEVLIYFASSSFTFSIFILS